MTRVLAIGRDAPWLGPRSGNSIRREAVLRGAARAGTVHYVMLSPSAAVGEPSPDYVASVVHVPTRRLRTGSAGHAAWQLAGIVHRDQAPYELTRHRLEDRARAGTVLRELCADHDVMWLLDKHAAFLVGCVLDPAPIPALLDVDEMVAQRDRQEAALLRAHDGTRLIDRIAARAHIAFLDRNALAWDVWTRRLAGRATVSAVAKTSDVDTLLPNRAVVVRNGCRVPPPRTPAAVRDRRPVLVFHGLMSYAPNADGATFLVQDVVPHIEREVGRDFEVRIVGKASAAVEALARRDARIVVTGYVDDIGAEVRNADVVVVPLRLGSGTRIKVLEALAECTPVVSTTIGCDGLGLIDGEHVLIADDPAAFAAACARVLDDAALRARLVEHGYRLVAEKFDWDVIEAEVARLTRALVART
ncbi:MAG: glycosyltransferase [Acidimicrobiia bacterium]